RHKAAALPGALVHVEAFPVAVDFPLLEPGLFVEVSEHAAARAFESGPAEPHLADLAANLHAADVAAPLALAQHVVHAVANVQEDALVRDLVLLLNGRDLVEGFALAARQLAHLAGEGDGEDRVKEL